MYTVVFIVHDKKTLQTGFTVSRQSGANSNASDETNYLLVTMSTDHSGQWGESSPPTHGVFY